MALLDPILEAIGDFFSRSQTVQDDEQRARATNPGLPPEAFTDDDLDPQDLEDLREAAGFNAEGDNPIKELTERIAGGAFDTLEDDILQEFDGVDLTNLDDVEDAVNEAEGAALTQAISVLLGQLTIELAGATQIESHEETMTRLLTFLALEDLLGIRSQVVAEQAVLPSLEAQVDKQNRTKFVDLQDAVELALRNKQADENYLSPSNAPQKVVDLIGSDSPENPDNLIEEWGIRDDNLPILEEVALEAMEFEELIETPAELGLIVPDDVLDEVLDINGYPEDLKDFLRQIPDEIPESNRLWEERTAVEPLVQELETLAADEEITPADAVALIPSEVDDAKPALERRFANLQTVPSGSPTRSAIEGSFASGYTDLQTLEDRLDRLEYDTSQYEDVLRKTVLDELDGDLQEAVGLGLLDEGAYSDLAAFAGLDGQTIDRLLRGQSFSDITQARLQEQADPAQLSVGTIVGIGESRARALDAAGVETVGDLAQADVADVEQAAQVSQSTAQDFIDQAQQRIS